MTNKGYIDWSTLLKDPTITAEHRNGNKRIVAATEILQQTAQQFVKVLHERAKLLANSAQFEAALRDAAAIRTISPVSGLGYLCTGDIYCQQGRYAAAIAIFDQGLQAVPESDPYRQQLEQHRIIAVTKSSRRVDFITKLPLDVVITRILPRLELKFSTRSSCELYVSRAWQQHFVQQPKGLHFDFGRLKHTLEQDHHQLVRFAPYVQKLECFMGDGYHLDDVFSKANFSKMKELVLSCDYTTPRPPLLNSLHLVADSLTHLTIRDCRSVELRDILESCLNLVSLKMDHVDAAIPSSSSKLFPNIKYLSLRPSRATLEKEDIAAILSRLPSLLWLEIIQMYDSSVLPILHGYCPHLQVLYDGCSSTEFHQAEKNIHPKQNGITQAHLSKMAGCYQDDLIQFLLLYRHSLEKLYFDGVIIKGDNPIWEILNGRLEQRDHQQSLQLTSQQSEPLFTRLVKFHFVEFVEYFDSSFIQWVILNAPNLKAIELDQVFIEPEISNAMIQLKHLSKLKINIFYPLPPDDNIGINQLLEHHVALGNDSTLEHIIVNMEVDVSQVTWIPLLSRLKRLRKLELLPRTMRQHCISILDGIGQGCPDLEELRINENTNLLEGLLMPLRQFSNLKHLRVQARSICNADLLVLASLTSLERLSLECDVPDDILVLLKSRIPKVYTNCK